MERVNFYVDGFNFYYGLRDMRRLDSDWQRFYWLDYVRFFQHFISNNQVLQNVIYFAAPPPGDTYDDTQRRKRQNLLFRTNKLLHPIAFETVMGQFYKKNVTCKVCKSKYPVYEEKQTDVNIATRLLVDCTFNKVDTLVLVSADSDLLPPLKLIKEHYPNKNIRVYFPPNNYSVVLAEFMKTENKQAVRLERNKIKFSNSIMPNVVTHAGKTYTIPQKWKI
jgi:uncharacterized LabA/DUF88 family protein